MNEDRTNLTVKELIEILKKCDPDAYVFCDERVHGIYTRPNGFFWVDEVTQGTNEDGYNEVTISGSCL